MTKLIAASYNIQFTNFQVFAEFNDVQHTSQNLTREVIWQVDKFHHAWAILSTVKYNDKLVEKEQLRH